MAFTFLHTADWQLGRPFRTFSPRVAALLEQARLEGIGRIAAIARQRGAAHVLVAGDVFDSDLPSDRTVAQAFDRLAAARGLTWHLLPGNHDPARPAGLWEQLGKRGLPANVVAHTTAQSVDMAPGVVLLPSPLTTKSQTSDPTAWMDGVATPPGAIRIGLAHGSVKDFTRAGDSTAIIDPARARTARLDYLALGDWHGTARIDARTWYSGTPEPDRFPDNEPGHVLLVTIDAAGREPRVERFASGHFTWIRQQIEVADAAALLTIERQLLAASGTIDRLLVKLTLTGSISATDLDTVRGWSEKLAERVCHLDADLDGLSSTLDERDIAALDLGADLQRAADHLRERAAGGDEATRDTAKAALGWLVRLVREGARERAP